MIHYGLLKKLRELRRRSMPWQGDALAVDRLLSSDGFGSEGASLFQLVVSRDVSYSLEQSRQGRTFDDKSGHLATRQLDGHTKRGVEHKGLGFTGLLFRL